MIRQISLGMPKHCYNRNCKASFHRDCHLGWLPKSETEVYAVMRCPKCNDTWKIVQAISIAHEYYEKLPKDSKNQDLSKTRITHLEMQQIKKQMDTDPKILNKLLRGFVPGASSKIPSREE